MRVVRGEPNSKPNSTPNSTPDRPRQGGAAATDPRVAVDMVMEAGDAVFVPAGAWHCGHDGGAADDPDGTLSVLVSLGLRSTQRDAAALTAAIARESERLRGLPFFATSSRGTGRARGVAAKRQRSVAT